MELLDFLLSGKCPDARVARKTKDVEVKRLSTKDCKAVFTLQAMSYDELIRLRSLPAESAEIRQVLDGIKEPSLKDPRFLQKEKGILTQEDVVRALFTPGEITSLAREVTKLSGFDRDAVTEVKNA